MTEPLDAATLRWHCPLAPLDFETTAELDADETIVGQAAAIDALRFGLAFRAPGQHVFVRGMEGTGRLTLVRQLLEDPGPLGETTRDRVVVMDFKRPDSPALVSLRQGRAPVFAEAMEQLGRYVTDALSEDLDVASRAARTELQSKAEAAMAAATAEFEKAVSDAGLAMARVTQENGTTSTRIVALIDGQPAGPAELQAAAAAGQIDGPAAEAAIAAIASFSASLPEITQVARAIQRDLATATREILSKSVRALLEAQTKPIQTAHPAATRFLKQVVEYTAEHLEVLQEHAEQLAATFSVNILTTHREGSKRPVVIPTAPSVSVLLGSVDATAGEGKPPHEGIHAGALLQADGGTLVLEARELLRHEGAWEALSRTLRTGILELLPEAGATALRPPGIKPPPIPVDVKVVLVGSEGLYHLLDTSDPDFPILFKVLADLDPYLRADDHAIRAYATVIATLSRREGLPAYHRDAVAALVEHGMRIATHDRHVTARFGRIADIAREAAFIADGETVERSHVEATVRRTKRRGGGPGRRFRQRIASGAVRIHTTGQALGEVNGLAVIQAGPLTYGMPTRISATAGPGREGPVNVEHEAKLSGQIHVKSFHILTGLLRRLVDVEHPLMLDASIAFEQSYGGIDGDSASGASFVALLSALSERPVRQDLAMTGAIDQVGNVLPIGAVNEKTEGFFDCCAQGGLTGTQGVIVPASNADDLMLRIDVVEAAESGRFAVYAVERIEDAIALFFGSPAPEVLDAARETLRRFWTVTDRRPSQS